MMWWNLPIPPKIKVFIWLIEHDKILTKDKLLIRGWIWNPSCQFCSEEETIDQLFLNCQFAHKIGFWLGKTQYVMHTWQKWVDLVDFAYRLNSTQQKDS